MGCYKHQIYTWYTDMLADKRSHKIKRNLSKTGGKNWLSKHNFTVLWPNLWIKYKSYLSKKDKLSSSDISKKRVYTILVLHGE